MTREEKLRRKVVEQDRRHEEKKTKKGEQKIKEEKLRVLNKTRGMNSKKRIKN